VGREAAATAAALVDLSPLAIAPVPARSRPATARASHQRFAHLSPFLTLQQARKANTSPHYSTIPQRQYFRAVTRSGEPVSLAEQRRLFRERWAAVLTDLAAA